MTKTGYPKCDDAPNQPTNQPTHPGKSFRLSIYAAAIYDALLFPPSAFSLRCRISQRPKDTNNAVDMSS